MVTDAEKQIYDTFERDSRAVLDTARAARTRESGEEGSWQEWLV